MSNFFILVFYAGMIRTTAKRSIGLRWWTCSDQSTQWWSIFKKLRGKKVFSLKHEFSRWWSIFKLYKLTSIQEQVETKCTKDLNLFNRIWFSILLTLRYFQVDGNVAESTRNSTQSKLRCYWIFHATHVEVVFGKTYASIWISRNKQTQFEQKKSFHGVP